MKKTLFIFISIPLLLFGTAFLVYAQGTSDYFKLITEDYTNISLPPLSLPLENAKGGPIYELAGVREQIERKLLAKEGRAFLKFFNTQGNYQWGKVGVDSAFTSASTPIMYNYNTSRQTMYTIGGAVSIPFDGLFDLIPRVKRQKLSAKATALEQEVKFEEMKREIIEMYTTATSQLNVLKLRAEALELATMQYDTTEKNFVNNTISARNLSIKRQRQSTALEAFGESKSEVTKSLIVLEVITRTPILRK